MLISYITNLKKHGRQYADTDDAAIIVILAKEKCKSKNKY